MIPWHKDLSPGTADLSPRTMISLLAQRSLSWHSRSLSWHNDLISWHKDLSPGTADLFLGTMISWHKDLQLALLIASLPLVGLGWLRGQRRRRERTLCILRAAVSDSGYYTCVVSNAVSCNETSFLLQVHHSANVLLPMVLACVIIGVLAGIFVWCRRRKNSSDDSR